MRCDVCGTLSQESGHQARTVEFEVRGWPREPATKAVRVTFSIGPVNYGDESYGGLDICERCFGVVIAEAIVNLTEVLKS